jgi:hypothetical protein
MVAGADLRHVILRLDSYDANCVVFQPLGARPRSTFSNSPTGTRTPSASSSKSAHQPAHSPSWGWTVARRDHPGCVAAVAGSVLTAPAMWPTSQSTFMIVPVFPGCHRPNCCTCISHGTVAAMQFPDYRATSLGMRRRNPSIHHHGCGIRHPKRGSPVLHA